MLEQYSDLILNEEVFPSGKTMRISLDTIQMKWKIVSSDRNEFEKMVDSFSVDNPTAFYSKIHGYNAPSRLYAVNQFGFFNLGMIFEVLKYIKTNFGSFETLAMSNNAKAFLKTYLTPLKDFANRQDKENFHVSNISNKYALRDYQEKAIKSIIFNGYGRGLLELPTGSGKSFVIANFIYTLLQQYDSSLKTLIFVPNKQLVEQFYKDLLDYGYKAEELGKLTGGINPKKFNKDAKIIIGNRQFLFSNKELLPKIDVLICDECHQISPNSSSYDFIENLNCKIKVGCSGTIPRDKFKKWSLIGLFSRIFYTENVLKLQSQGYLTKLHIRLIDIIDKMVDNNPNILFSLKAKTKYNDFNDIAYNEAYNAELEYLSKNCEKLYSPVFDVIENDLKGNILVLFDRIEFGKNIFELAKERKMRCSEMYYIDGNVPVAERENIRNIFENSNNNILFAQAAVMSTGVNIKNLPTIIFMFQTKSPSRVIQSIGRTLRLHENKNFSNVLDIRFSHKYSRKHFNERLKLYEEFYGKKKPDEISIVEI